MMGKRGPRPKPTALRVLEGNPGHKKMNRSEPKPEAAIPTCPSWLPATAKSEWRRVTRELHAMGLLSRADRSTLAAYCQVYSDWHQAEHVIQKLGPTFETPNGYVQQRPEVAMKHKALSLLAKFASLFGLSPADRVGLEIKKESAEDELQKALSAPRRLPKRFTSSTRSSATSAH